MRTYGVHACMHGCACVRACVCICVCASVHLCIFASMHLYGREYHHTRGNRRGRNAKSLSPSPSLCHYHAQSARAVTAGISRGTACSYVNGATREAEKQHTGKLAGKQGPTRERGRSERMGRDVVGRKVRQLNSATCFCNSKG